MSKVVEPSIAETAFSCPHCGAFTTQHWYKLRAKEVTGEILTPTFPTDDAKEIIARDRELPSNKKEELYKWIDKVNSGIVSLHPTTHEALDTAVINLHVSECYNCEKFAVWVHGDLIFPPHKRGTNAISDLPDDIIKDFDEARSIVDQSPRGAAALLRLCVQKLCGYLGGKGKNIDDDIASLVKKGLNPLVQQSLDIVRVIGNEAVHPGTLDLKDDRNTALRLFDLVNSIAEQMISHPKKIQEMYSKLPQAKRDAIEKRDAST